MRRTPRLATDTRLIRRCLVFLTVLAAIWAMQRFEDFLLPTMIGLFLALILTPVAARVEAFGVPRALAALLVVVTTLVGLAAVVYVALPGYEEYRDRGPEILREVERKIAPIRQQAEEVGIIEEERPPIDELRTRPDITPVDSVSDLPPSADAAGVEGSGVDAGPLDQDMARRFATDIAMSAPVLIGKVLYILFLTLFTILDRRRLMRGAMMTQSTFGGRAWTARVIRDMRTKVASFLLMISLVNIGLGLATAVVFWALGMPSPLLWGAAMALLNFIPFIGPLIMNAIVFAVAFVHFPTLGEALLPVGALLILNMIEGNFVTPMLVGSRVLNGSLGVFIAVTFGAWLWGPVGALLATPALIVITTLMTARRSARRPLRTRNIRKMLEEAGAA